MRNLIRTLLLCLTSTFAIAQENSEITQFYNNIYLYNPSYAGHLYGSQFKLLTRFNSNQNGNSVFTSILTYQGHPELNDKVGFGLMAARDQYVFLNNKSNRIGGAINYRHDLAANSFVRGGIQANYFSITDTDDDVKASAVDLDFGLYFQQEHFFLSASGQNIIKSALRFDSQNTITEMQTQMYIMGGYIFELSPKIKMTPSIMIRRVTTRPVTIEANTQFLFLDKLLFAATYRTFSNSTGFLRDNYPWSFGLGYKASQIYEVSFAADFPGFNQGFVLNNFYELMLSMEFE